MESGVSTSSEADETVVDDITDIQSDGVMLEAKHKVFLSHSGAQKDFVEQLCVDFERCDRHPFFDKRWSSLPIGEKFPPLIFDAIRQCHVGVLVLSKEFFTKTKWPMLELVAMVRELKSPNSRLKLIPVFYKLSREEWLDHENRLKWFSQWKEWANVDERICIEEWKKALDGLKSINSLMMRDGEVHLRREIVDAVCKLVLPETRWDDSHVQGRSRMCEILLQKLDEQEKRNGIQVLGLYGIGGIGKTTMCKAMCNEVFERYGGRVCHVELNTISEVGILQNVLRRLSTIEHGHVGGLNIDECRDNLRRCIVKQPVFLAIDNLLDNLEARKQAKTLLRTRWAEGSVVIVATRALGELTYLNPYIGSEDCTGMPELMKEEARSLFLNHVTCGQGATIAMLDEGLVSRCVERCHFGKGKGLGRHYIPLALEVLGEQLGCNGYDAELWEEQLKNIDVFKEKLRKDEHPIFSILRTSYDSLSQDVQMLFMDTALFLPSHPFPPMHVWNFFDWLSTVHGTSVGEVMRQLEYLKRRSLLESLGDGRTRMVMHDLWREFCVAEATIGQFEDGRCLFVEEESSKLAETSPGPGGCWRNMKRMCFLNEGWRCLDGVQVDQFVNLLLLKVESGSFSLGGSLELDVKGLRHLKSLELRTGKLNVKCAGLGCLTKLTYLRWYNRHTPPPDVEEIGSLTKLEVLILDSFKGDKLPDLSMLTSLRLVSFVGCIAVKTIRGLSSKLTNIQSIDLRKCYTLEECPGVGELYALEEVYLGFCGQLKDVPCLRMLTRLRILNIVHCQLLRAVPGLSDLVALEDLWASGCTALEVLPDLRKLSKLRKLVCAGCSALKRLTCTTPLRAVEQIDFRDCNSLEEMPDLSTFPQLKWLYLAGCRGLMTLTSSAPLRALLVLDLEGCSKLSALPDHLSGSVDLEELSLEMSGIVLHEDEIRDLKVCCRRLEVFPSTSDWSCYVGWESSSSSGSVSSGREVKVDDLEVINAQNGCRSRRLPDGLDQEKIARLMYTRAGGGLLALTSNGIHKLWNWGRVFDDPECQATTSFAPQLGLHASGRLMANEMNMANLEEVVHTLALTNNGIFMVSSSGIMVSEYKIDTLQRTITFMYPPPAPTSIAFYPHIDNFLAIGMADSTIQILNLSDGLVVCTLGGHHDKVIGLAFSEDSANYTSVLVSLSSDAQLCVWNTEKWSKRGARLRLLQPDQTTACAGDLRVQFHNDQRHVLVVGKSQLAVYDTLNVDRPDIEWVPQSPFTAAITDATYSCDGLFVYVGFADGSVGIVDAQLRPRHRWVPPIHPPLEASGSTAYPVAIAAHPRIEEQFAMGMSDGSVIVVEPWTAPAVIEAGSGEGSSHDVRTPNRNQGGSTKFCGLFQFCKM